MKRSDLRTGMVVYTRDKKRGMIFRNICTDGMSNGRDIIVFNNGTWSLLSDYDDDLTCPDRNCLDIIKVKAINTSLELAQLLHDVHCDKTLWERKEARKMTVAEIEIALGYKVEIISEK